MGRGKADARIPVIERPDGTWRAIQKGVSVEPSVAYLYITRALKDHTAHVLGAMQLVAESYEPDELDVVALHLYVSCPAAGARRADDVAQNEFKPDVVEWGQRGSVSVASILEQVKGPVVGSEVEEGGESGKAKAEVDGGDAPKDEKEAGQGDDDEDSPLSAAPDSPVPKPTSPAAADRSLEEYDEDGFDDAALLALPLP